MALKDTTKKIQEAVGATADGIYGKDTALKIISKLGFWILTDLITGKVRIISPILSILEIQIFPLNILLNQTISFVKYMKILKFFPYAI